MKFTPVLFLSLGLSAGLAFSSSTPVTTTIRSQNQPQVVTLEPQSLNIEIVASCFSELDSPSLRKAFNLGALKEVMDQRFTTARSLMVERVVIFTDSSEVKKRLRVWTTEGLDVAKPTYLVQLDFYDAKGLTHEQMIPPEHQKNPSIKFINSFLASAQMLSDRQIFIERKLKGFETVYRQNFGKIEELKFKRSKPQRQLSCQVREGDAILCECIKK